MPRYASFQIKSAEVLKNSPPLSVESKLRANQAKNYTDLSNDLRISWDGDLKIDENTGDYVVSYDLEAFTQRLYRRLITQKGTYPGEPDFGWDFEYLFGIPVSEQRELLPYIAKELEKSLLLDSEVSSVSDIKIQIVRDDFRSHKIVIEVLVIPKGYNSNISISMESL